MLRFTGGVAGFARLSGIGLLLSGSVMAGGSESELEAFPAAKTGSSRYVIVLPEKNRDEEQAFKVELVPGKTMMTDGVNQVRLGAAIEARTLQGWGYTYYEVEGSGEMMSTLMAVPEGTPRKETFVAGEPLIIRYNSRLPVVVYAPDDFEVHFRIWQAPEVLEIANPG